MLYLFIRGSNVKSFSKSLIQKIFLVVAFADALKEVFHKVGIVARLGGDEFAVILEKNLDDHEVYVS